MDDCRILRLAEIIKLRDQDVDMISRLESEQLDWINVLISSKKDRNKRKNEPSTFPSVNVRDKDTELFRQALLWVYRSRVAAYQQEIQALTPVNEPPKRKSFWGIRK